MVYIPKQQILTRFRRYKALNETRLQRSLSLMNHETRFCMSIVPVLLHYNHINLPGYRDGYIPHGIDLFSLDDLQRRYVSDMVLPGSPPLEEPKDHAILGLYAMGSTSSLGQTKKSDVDIWVCVKANLSETGTLALQDKCRFITDYVKAHNVELNLFVTPEDRFTNFQPDSLDEENCGSAQNLFLLDEFYRSSIRLCGRYILWYLISTTEEHQSYEAYSDFLTKGISGMPALRSVRPSLADSYAHKVTSVLGEQVAALSNSNADPEVVAAVAAATAQSHTLGAGLGGLQVGDSLPNSPRPANTSGSTASTHGITAAGTAASDAIASAAAAGTASAYAAVGTAADAAAQGADASAQYAPAMATASTAAQGSSSDATSASVVTVTATAASAVGGSATDSNASHGEALTAGTTVTGESGANAIHAGASVGVNGVAAGADAANASTAAAAAGAAGGASAGGAGADSGDVLAAARDGMGSGAVQGEMGVAARAGEVIGQTMRSSGRKIPLISVCSVIANNTHFIKKSMLVTHPGARRSSYLSVYENFGNTGSASGGSNSVDSMLSSCYGVDIGTEATDYTACACFDYPSGDQMLQAHPRVIRTVPRINFALVSNAAADTIRPKLSTMSLAAATGEGADSASGSGVGEGAQGIGKSVSKLALLYQSRIASSSNHQIRSIKPATAPSTAELIAAPSDAAAGAAAAGATVGAAGAAGSAVAMRGTAGAEMPMAMDVAATAGAVAVEQAVQLAAMAESSASVKAMTTEVASHHVIVGSDALSDHKRAYKAKSVLRPSKSDGSGSLTTLSGLSEDEAKAAVAVDIAATVAAGAFDAELSTTAAAVADDATALEHEQSKSFATAASADTSASNSTVGASADTASASTDANSVLSVHTELELEIESADASASVSVSVSTSPADAAAAAPVDAAISASISTTNGAATVATDAAVAGGAASLTTSAAEARGGSEDGTEACDASGVAAASGASGEDSLGLGGAGVGAAGQDSVGLRTEQVLEVYAGTSGPVQDDIDEGREQRVKTAWAPSSADDAAQVSADVALADTSVLLSLQGAHADNNALSEIDLSSIEYGATDSSVDSHTDYAPGSFCKIEVLSGSEALVSSHTGSAFELAASASRVSVSQSKGGEIEDLEYSSGDRSSKSWTQEHWQPESDDSGYDRSKGRHKVTYEGHIHDADTVSLTDNDYHGTDFINGACNIEHVLHINEHSEHHSITTSNPSSHGTAHGVADAATASAPAAADAATSADASGVTHAAVCSASATAVASVAVNAASAVAGGVAAASAAAINHVVGGIAASGSAVAAKDSAAVRAEGGKAAAGTGLVNSSASGASASAGVSAGNGSRGVSASMTRLQMAQELKEAAQAEVIDSAKLSKIVSQVLASDEVDTAQKLSIYDTIADAGNSAVMTREEYLQKAMGHSIRVSDGDEGADAESASAGKAGRGLSDSDELQYSDDELEALEGADLDEADAYDELELEDGYDTAADGDIAAASALADADGGSDLAAAAADGAAAAERAQRVRNRAKAMRRVRNARRNEAVAKAGAQMARKLTGAGAVSAFFQKLLQVSEQLQARSGEETFKAFSNSGSYRQENTYTAMSTQTAFVIEDATNVDSHTFVTQSREEAVYGYPGFDAAIERDSRHHAILTLRHNLAKEGAKHKDITLLTPQPELTDPVLSIKANAPASRDVHLRRTTTLYDSEPDILSANTSLLNEATSGSLINGFGSDNGHRFGNESALNSARRPNAFPHRPMGVSSTTGAAVPSAGLGTDIGTSTWPSPGQEGEFVNGPLSSSIPNPTSAAGSAMFAGASGASMGMGSRGTQAGAMGTRGAQTGAMGSRLGSSEASHYESGYARMMGCGGSATGANAHHGYDDEANLYANQYAGDIFAEHGSNTGSGSMGNRAHAAGSSNQVGLGLGVGASANATNGGVRRSATSVFVSRAKLDRAAAEAAAAAAQASDKGVSSNVDLDAPASRMAEPHGHSTNASHAPVAQDEPGNGTTAGTSWYGWDAERKTGENQANQNQGATAAANSVAGDAAGSAASGASAAGGVGSAELANGANATGVAGTATAGAVRQTAAQVAGGANGAAAVHGAHGGAAGANQQSGSQAGDAGAGGSGFERLAAAMGVAPMPFLGNNFQGMEPDALTGGAMADSEVRAGGIGYGGRNAEQLLERNEPYYGMRAHNHGMGHRLAHGVNHRLRGGQVISAAEHGLRGMHGPAGIQVSPPAAGLYHSRGIAANGSIGGIAGASPYGANSVHTMADAAYEADSHGYAYPVRSYGNVLSEDESLKAAALDGFREYEAPLNPDEWFDFGSVVFSSPTEYFGSGLWLLYKAIESPLKVVLKILLMEAYSSDYPHTQLLSSELKDYMLSHDGYSIDLDSYYLMYRKVSDYLIASGHDDRLSLMRKCFYLKIYDGLGNSTQNHRDDSTLKRELLDKFARRWDWDKAFVSDLEQFNTWKMAPVRSFNREVYRTLLESYQALLRFSVRHGIEYAITSDDAGILSRKLYAAFDRYPGKISVMHTSFTKNLEEMHLTFVCPSKESLCRRGWHMYTAAKDDVSMLNLKVAYIGERLSEVVTWACFNGLMTSRSMTYVAGAPTVVTPLMIKQLAGDIMRVIGSKRGRVSEKNLQRTSRLRACLVVLNLEHDETELFKHQMLDTDYGSTLCCGRQRVCLVGSIDLVLINSWGEIRSISLPSGEEGVVELLATLLRILRNTTEVGQEDESITAMLETIEVCSYAIAYQDLIKYDVESVLRQVFNCYSSTSSSEYSFDVGRNTYIAKEQGDRGIVINKKNSFGTGEYDISVLSRYGMRPEFALQVPPVIDRYATAGIMQYFFTPVAKTKGHWDIYIINERNEVATYSNYIGSRAALVNAINRFYTEQSRNASSATARFNLPQYFVISKDLKTIHPFTIHTNQE